MRLAPFQWRPTARTPIPLACVLVGLAACGEPFRETIPVGNAIRRHVESPTCQGVTRDEFFDGAAVVAEEMQAGARCRIRLPADARALRALGITVAECGDEAHVDVIIDIDTGASVWEHNPLETAQLDNDDCTVA